MSRTSTSNANNDHFNLWSRHLSCVLLWRTQITRYWFTAAMLATCAVSFGLIADMSLVWFWPAVWNKFEVSFFVSSLFIILSSLSLSHTHTCFPVVFILVSYPVVANRCLRIFLLFPFIFYTDMENRDQFHFLRQVQFELRVLHVHAVSFHSLIIILMLLSTC